MKINDLSLFRICLLVLEHMNKPPRRVWQQRQGLTIHIRTSEQEEINEAKKKVEQQKLLAKAQQTKSRIEELSNVLDHPIATPDPTENTAIDASAAGESPAQTETSDPAPRFPVDPGKIAVDQPKKKDDQDGLSAYDGVFRDISPNP